jgi:hypothetical protein
VGGGKEIFWNKCFLLFIRKSLVADGLLIGLIVFIYRYQKHGGLHHLQLQQPTKLSISLRLTWETLTIKTKQLVRSCALPNSPKNQKTKFTVEQNQVAGENEMK